LPDIVRAENCHLFDSRGRRYVDLESGVWCTSIGHGHPRILRVLAEQAARISHAGFNYSSAVVTEAARDILSLAGLPDGRCVFLCSGSEAVEYGVRAAQAVCERPLLLTMADSYFGAYGSASRRQKDEWFCFDWTACAACPHSGECDDRCEHWSAIPLGRIGGFLFEPGSSSGLVRFPPDKLIRNLAGAVHGHGGFVLVNEVTTGIGRTGRWFGYQHYDLLPDIVAMGKGVGNGYPVSVTAIGPRVTQKLGDQPIKYAQSHQNDPLGAAVLREVIRVIDEEGLIERSRRLGDLFRSELARIQARSGRIKDVRGRGLMIAVELADDTENTVTIRAHRELLHRGFVTGRRPGINVLRLDPALTVEERDLQAFLETLEDVLTGLTG
jgi:acetylornithine/N-succinyldiaminopimelate aminotransferase